MKLAVTYDNGQIFQHFGHTEYFKIYTIEDNTIKDSAVVSTNGSGHGALAGFLKEHQVDALICGGIGGGAKAALATAGIELYPGVSGSADEQVQNYLRGTLRYNADTECDHHSHHHEDGHSCHHHEGHTCGHPHHMHPSHSHHEKS